MLRLYRSNPVHRVGLVNWLWSSLINAGKALGSRWLQMISNVFLFIYMVIYYIYYFVYYYIYFFYRIFKMSNIYVASMYLAQNVHFNYIHDCILVMTTWCLSTVRCDFISKFIWPNLTENKC